VSQGLKIKHNFHWHTNVDYTFMFFMGFNLKRTRKTPIKFVDAVCFSSANTCNHKFSRKSSKSKQRNFLHTDFKFRFEIGLVIKL